MRVSASRRYTLARDAQGRVALDRSPEYFRWVLDYLRNGGVLPANLPTDQRELRRVQQVKKTSAGVRSEFDA